MYVILRCVWPALKLLRIADLNKPGMDRLYYLTHKAEEVIKKSTEFIDDLTLFGTSEVNPQDEDDANYSSPGIDDEGEIDEDTAAL